MSDVSRMISKDFIVIPPGNPKVLKLKGCKERHTPLSLLPMAKWLCKWCFVNNIKTHRHHYCSSQCSLSAQIYCYPQGPYSRYYLQLKQNYKCKCCDKDFAKKERGEIDHIIPIFKGGDALGPDNLQLLCEACHLTKTITERKKDGPSN